MAFVDPDQVKPSQNLPQGQQQAPIAAGGAGVGGSTKAATTPGQNVPAQPSAQLSAYLAANQPQATAFSGNVAQTVGGQVSAAGAGIQPAVNTYTGQLYTVPTDDTVNSAVAKSPSSLTPDQAATFKAEAAAASKAPNPAGTFETTQGYQDTAAGIQSAVEQANLWNSGNDLASISTALVPFEGANATPGDRTLDSILLSRTPAAYKNISAAAAPATGLQGNLAAGTTAANAALKDAIAKDMAATDAAKASGAQYAGNLSKTLAGYLAQAQKDADTYNSGVNALSTGVSNLQPKTSALKDAVAAYNAMQAENPATNLLPKIQYGDMGGLPMPVAAPEIGQLATAGQYSDVAALLDLLGPDAPAFPIDPANAAMAGTYKSPINSIPAVNGIVAPFSNPVGPNLLKAGDVYQEHLNNPALWNGRGAFDSVQAAYDALQSAMGWQAPGSGDPNQVPPPVIAPPPPPTDAIAPVNGQPGNESWFNYFQSINPGLDNVPGTYAEYLQRFANPGGYRPI